MLLVDVFAAGVRIAAPVVAATLGETFSERAGVINVGLEGMMLTGAFVGVLAAFYTGDPVIGLVAAILGGAFIGLIHAFVSVTLGGNQIVSGVGLNFLALGATSFLLDVFFPGQSAQAERGLGAIAIPGLADIPGIGRIFFNQSLAVYVIYALVPASIFVLYKTEWGLRVIASGENPAAADAVGVSVTKTRYQAVLLAGGLAGFGGGVLALSQLRFFTDNMIQGRGFIALAAVYFGNLRPGWAALGAGFFGIIDALQLRLQAAGVGIPAPAMTMLPYVLSIVVLTSLVGRSRLPTYLARAYVRGEK